MSLKTTSTRLVMRPQVLLLAENTGLGGINTYVIELARALKDRDVPVEVMAVWPKEECWLDLQCQRYGVPLSVLAKRRSPLLAPNCIWRLAGKLKSGQFSILHTQGHYSDLVGRSAYLLSGRRVRLVSTVHGITSDPRVSLRTLYWLDWNTYIWNHATIANSEHTASELKRLRVKAKTLTVILPGLPGDDGGAAHNTRQRGGSDLPTIVFVGRLSPEKGCAVLIEAAQLLKARNRRLRILIVGEGPARRSLEMQVSALGLQSEVTFEGWQVDVRSFYEQARVVVVPSLRESFGLTALEAMRDGCAVIASRIEGIPEIISDGETGLLVNPGDAASLAAALERCLDDDDLCDRLGRAAREMVTTRYSIEGMVAKTLEVYRDALHC